MFAGCGGIWLHCKIHLEIPFLITLIVFLIWLMLSAEVYIYLLYLQFPCHSGFPDFEAVFWLPSFMSLLSCVLLANVRGAPSTLFLPSFRCHLGEWS